MKINIKTLDTYPVRNALSVGIVVFLATLINIYYSFSKEYWIVLAAFLACQRTKGAPLRYAIICFLIMIVTMLIVSLMKIISIPQTILYFILGTVFVLGEYFYIKNFLMGQNIFIKIFLFTWIITGLTPFSSYLMVQDRVFDILIGTLIGISGQFIFPIKIYEEFRQGIIPVLQKLLDYTSLVSDYFLNPNHTQLDQLDFNKNEIQLNLQLQQGSYPEWVYESGFNPGLRSGYRFFLIHLERMIEVFFSLNYYINREVDAELLNTLSYDLSISMRRNKELLEFLLQYFKKGKIEDTTASDFTTDILNLEKTLQNNIPTSIELLDISQDYVILVALVSDIKNIRELLLSLVSALSLTPAVQNEDYLGAR